MKKFFPYSWSAINCTEFGGHEIMHSKSILLSFAPKVTPGHSHTNMSTTLNKPLMYLRYESFPGKQSGIYTYKSDHFSQIMKTGPRFDLCGTPDLIAFAVETYFIKA